MRYLIVLLLAGCATNATLMPRGPGPQGTGTIDSVNRDMVVELDGKRYRGKVISGTSISQTQFGRTETSYGNAASALLVGDQGGQIRCDMTYDRMMTTATGVCVDSRNVTYDLILK